MPFSKPFITKIINRQYILSIYYIKTGWINIIMGKKKSAAREKGAKSVENDGREAGGDGYN